MTISQHATVNPVFLYRDCAAAIAWLIRAYGFEQHELHQAPDGTVVHAELRFGDAGIGLSAAGPADADNPWSMVRSGIYVSLAEVDAVHDRARAAGAQIAQPIRDTNYGSREFSARDPGGHLWSFGTYGMTAKGAAPSLFVTLLYNDGRASIDWLTRAFGFEKILEVPGENGAIDHAELRLGDGILMASSTPASTGHWGAERQCTCVYTPDPDAHFARAQAAGAAIIQTPHDTPYGARSYYSRDPEGFLWGFSDYRPRVESRKVGK